MPTFTWNDWYIGGPIQCTSSARVGGRLPKCSRAIVRRRRMPSDASTIVPSTSHSTQVHGDRLGIGTSLCGGGPALRDGAVHAGEASHHAPQILDLGGGPVGEQRAHVRLGR